jgi:hypothetical protein
VQNVEKITNVGSKIELKCVEAAEGLLKCKSLSKIQSENIKTKTQLLTALRTGNNWGFAQLGEAQAERKCEPT